MMDAYREIENLVATYAWAVDDGDFNGIGELFADAEFRLNGGRVARGREEVTALGAIFRIYDDGTPRTRHVISNLVISADEEAGTATSRAYFTIFQALPDFPLQPISAGRYHDEFVRRDGRWRFASRVAMADMHGDRSRHSSAARH